MDESQMLAYFIADGKEPEDGLTYEEVAAMLWRNDDYYKSHKGADAFRFDDIIQEEYRNDYKEKVDRVIYVLQHIIFEFIYNTTLKPGCDLGPSIFPIVMSTEKIKDDDGKIITYDEPIEVIFNGAKEKYLRKALEKADKLLMKDTGNIFQKMADRMDP